MGKLQKNQDILNRIINDREKHKYFAYSLLRDHDAAEDAVSDSIIRLLKKWDTLDKTDFPSMNGYFYKILRSTCISELRRRSQTEKRFRHIMDADIEVLDKSLLSENIEANEIEKILSDARSKVDSSSYDYFICNRVKGMTYKEIAEQYNVSEGKVMRGIRKVLHLLKDDLEEYLLPLIAGFILSLPALIQ